MTRINSAIEPKCLTDEHLLAEHREIKRICTFANRQYKNLPKEFTLGKGHVLFFVDKPFFTWKRYVSLYYECIRRGFNVEDYGNNWLVYPEFKYEVEYTPTEKERDLLIERITDRLVNTKKPYWHYYGKRINKEEAISLL